MNRVFTAICALALCSCVSQPELQTLYVGTYGTAIHVLSYNPQDGSLTQTDSIPSLDASYIAFGETPGTLYAVSERGEESRINFFRNGGEGWPLEASSSGTGADPCYVSVIPGSGITVTADYSSGSFTVFSTEEATLGKVLQQERFEGSHIHQAREIPASILEAAGIEGRYILISDLGCDLIRVEKLCPGEDTVLRQVAVIPCGEGSGPRHMEFNPAESVLYCLTELSGEVLVWKIANAGGEPSFEELQRLKADGYDAAGSADIHLHPSGKWLYTSHRLRGDGISIIDVLEGGLLEKSAYLPTGIHPRNFTFSPDGTRVLVACRDSRSIEVYDIDPVTGFLSDSFQRFEFTSDGPVCLLFE